MRSKEANAIHFAFGVDANYVKYAGVLMTNLVHQHIGKQLCFHLAMDGLSKEDEERLNNFTALYRGTEIYGYQADDIISQLNLPSENVPPRLNRSVLLRVLLPQFLPRQLKRVIYMDVDMLARGSMESLWKLDLKGCPLAALPERTENGNADRLSLSSGKYFNAGIMVIDLELWRRRKLTEKVTACYQQNTSNFLMMEQDALNTVLDGDFLPLDIRYNRQLEANNPAAAKWEPEDVVLHFVNEAKPWTKGCLQEFYDMYWQYVKLSLWQDIEPLEPTTVKAGYLAGKNAEARGDYKEAAHYLGITAARLMEYYLYESEPKNKNQVK